jgi:predicted dehydrogenase
MANAESHGTSSERGWIRCHYRAVMIDICAGNLHSVTFSIHMNIHSETTRRNFLKTATKATAVSALAGVVIPNVHAAGTDTVQIALVGCGGRGTGAADNALTVKNGPVKLMAVADISEGKVKATTNGLKAKHGDKVDIGEKKFIGFDAYKQAIDTLKKGDIAIFATPPAFRWVHFQYAIERGVNVFMEKPVCTDGPSGRKMLALGEEATKAGLKVGVGLMCRHCRVRGELYDRIQQGEIGDVLMLRAYRMHPPAASFRSKVRPEGISELEYQIQRFHSFLWASGGCFSDFYIHNIDEACWMKNGWPVEVRANGGRNFREDWIDQNFDSYSCEYTFADGSKFFFEGRNMEGCRQEFATYAHGSKGMAIVSKAGHSPARSKIFKGHNEKSENVLWQGPKEELNPYELEWEDLVDAVRNNKPYNEVERGVKASLVTAMGRWSAHTGQIITFDDFLNSKESFAPDVDKLQLGGPAPLAALKDGKYPVPQPGVKEGPVWKEYYV